MMLEPARLRDFAERYTGAWCSQNAPSVAAFFASNGSLSVNGAPAVGRSAMTEVAQGFMTAFPDMHLLMDDIVVQGDRAVRPQGRLCANRLTSRRFRQRCQGRGA